MSSRKMLANAIRVLSMDAVQRANSGHPGAPMGMADIAEVLYNDFMRHNPANPEWSDRDRFVMSNGHGSMLPYSVLHLTGYDVTIEDLKNFRQLHSKTPGHPEYGYAPGIETTTGPLGQGISNAVGMAIAERALAAEFNRDDFDIVDHFTYVFLGDGCMMEGISHESCSLAGTLGLGKLIAFWDDNGISIDGKVEDWFLDDTPKRFEAYGWHVVEVDGHNADEIKIAIEAARAITAKPSLICCKTIIGFGSPNKAGGHACHGAPLGEEEVALARIELNWEHEPFVIPDQVYRSWDHRERGQAQEDAWQQKFDGYRAEHPELAAEFERRINRELPENWEQASQAFIAEVDETAEDKATRQASLAAIEAYSPLLPELFGGSADL
ncbi:MAG: transketolase, partial [Gammaproteobacteria bacterium]